MNLQRILNPYSYQRSKISASSLGIGELKAAFSSAKASTGEYDQLYVSKCTSQTKGKYVAALIDMKPDVYE
jgi:hypothetical protein